MTWLLNLIPGGSLTAILACAVAVLGVLWRLAAGIKKSGVDQRKAEELDAYEKHIKEIADAADARPVGGVSDDPHNRDRQ